MFGKFLKKSFLNSISVADLEASCQSLREKTPIVEDEKSFQEGEEKKIYQNKIID